MHTFGTASPESPRGRNAQSPRGRNAKSSRAQNDKKASFSYTCSYTNTFIRTHTVSDPVVIATMDHRKHKTKPAVIVGGTGPGRQYEWGGIMHWDVLYNSSFLRLDVYGDLGQGGLELIGSGRVQVHVCLNVYACSFVCADMHKRVYAYVYVHASIHTFLMTEILYIPGRRFPSTCLRPAILPTCLHTFLLTVLLTFLHIVLLTTLHSLLLTSSLTYYLIYFPTNLLAYCLSYLPTYCLTYYLT
jgi:hypothetical protein